ncbi:MAG: Bax inhibitor-1/YccA family protein [Puniceicoccales bacterium]|nr:Bax inhibitor-1/YccA family protein [Puniceicoccales bacterium]
MSYNTSNPILSVKNFEHSGGKMATTLNGVINRCLILLAMVMFSAVFAWRSKYISVEALSSKLTLFAIAGLIAAIVTVVKKEWSWCTAPLYAILEGLVLGSISKIFELRYHGIVFQAVALTFGTAAGMLLLYKYNVITVTDKFRAIVTTATFGIAIVYFVGWILSLFGGGTFMHSGGVVGLLFSLFVVTIAALNLLLDFDLIAKVSNRGLPSYMGWFAAFGLMVTLIWLYLEILRMLSKMRER